MALVLVFPSPHRVGQKRRHLPATVDGSSPVTWLHTSGLSGRPMSDSDFPFFSSFMKYFCACVRTCSRQG